MDAVKTLPTMEKEHEARYVSFEVDDNRGREIGAHLYTFQVDFVPAPDATAYYDIAPGTYYAVTPHAARGGVLYGPMPTSKYFPTADERTLYIEKYLAAAKKRAQKKSA